MAETKFTPGPWEPHVSDVRGTLCVIAENTWICGELWNDVAPLTEAEANANSRLIAAAPELYQALEAFVAAENDTNNPSISIQAYDKAMEEALHKAVKALAKARGEAI